MNMSAKHMALLPVIGLLCSSVMAQTAVFTGTTLVGDAPPETSFFLGDFFGEHVTSNSKWLIIGAQRESVDLDNDGLDGAQGDLDVGAVYIYKRTAHGLVFHQKLIGEGNNRNPDTPGDLFGSGVVLQGNTLFVAAANDDNFPGFVDPTPGPAQNFSYAGQVYVYNYNAKKDRWVLVQKLISDEPNSAGSFGSRTYSSHMELFTFGDPQSDPIIALIGETEYEAGPSVLHVFQRKANSTQWNRIQKVMAPSGSPDADFADSVEGVGEFALIPETLIDLKLDPARVHVYRVGPNGLAKTGSEIKPVQTLVSPRGPNNVKNCYPFGFGRGLAAAKDVAVIADPCDGTEGQQAGAVYVYKVDPQNASSPLSLVQTLVSPNARPLQFFAASFGPGKQTVATDGDLIVVGSPFWQYDIRKATCCQDDVHVFAREAGANTFSLADSIPSPSPGTPGFEIYGESVTLLGNGQLAIAQMTDGELYPVFDYVVTGQLFLFDIE